MLYWAAVFFIIGIIAAVFGFTGITTYAESRVMYGILTGIGFIGRCYSQGQRECYRYGNGSKHMEYRCDWHCCSMAAV